MNPKYRQAVLKRQQKDKEKILEYLREMPVKEVAFKKSGISRATYHRWCAEDPAFAEESENALQTGTDFINDMNESQIIVFSKDKYWPAIRYWLEHNHPKYLRVSRSVIVGTDTFRVEIPYDQTQ
jgi:hypothetical protein